MLITEPSNPAPAAHKCARCGAEHASRNLLFKHLQTVAACGEAAGVAGAPRVRVGASAHDPRRHRRRGRRGGGARGGARHRARRPRRRLAAPPTARGTAGASARELAGARGRRGAAAADAFARAAARASARLPAAAPCSARARRPRPRRARRVDDCGMRDARGGARRSRGTTPLRAALPLPVFSRYEMLVLLWVLAGCAGPGGASRPTPLALRGASRPR